LWGTWCGSRGRTLPVSIDINIFNKVLRNFLEPGEWIEADEEGYRGHPDKIKCPGSDANPAENRAMQGRVRARHEALNGRLKNWGILSQVFRHHIMKLYTVISSINRLYELFQLINSGDFGDTAPQNPIWEPAP
jgi:hypothetical protein